MPYGYHGKILHVHLGEMRTEVEEPNEAFYRKYLGGSALGAYYLLKHTPPETDPLAPENTLTLAAGVVTGTPIAGNSRLASVAKSPLTGGIGDAQSGGFFPAELKFAGYDAIVVHGKAESPVYLWIKDGDVELRSAEHLWGKDTGTVEEILKAELGDAKVQILQTGIAGENGVRYAAIISMANRANGRTGMGAVMASKNLKAVAVRGKMRPQLADKKALGAHAKWGAENFEDSDIYGMGLFGTAEVVASQQESGGLPTLNWGSGVFDGWEAIDGKTMANTILKERDTCYACTVRCKRVVETERAEPKYGGPEYETISTFGSYCGVDDLEAIAYANQLCNMYGLDTISCGATIAWAMDANERGLLPAEASKGIDLKFGNAEAMLTLVEQIARREGFGNILAEGSAKAAEMIGNGTEDLVVVGHRQEAPAHMPQVKRSLGLIYAVNPFGADHQSSEHDPSYEWYPERMEEIGLTDPQPADNLNEEKVKFALTTQKLYSALDSASMCQFVFGPSWHLYGPDQFLEAIQLITGWDMDMDELIEVGERRLNMMRWFNAQTGLTREDDKLPKKFYQALQGGPSDGVKLTEEELEAAKDMYFEMAGWDVESGNPTEAKLAELGIS